MDRGGGIRLLAWRVATWRLALSVFACFIGIGVLGTWEFSMITLSQVLVAVAVTVAFAIPLGIVAAKSDTFEKVSRPILDAMQTMPAFVYLIPVLLLFGPGRVQDHRVVRLRAAGRDPSHEPRHPAGAQGDRRGRRGLRVDLAAVLGKVQLPLAKPSILLGVNQTIMMVLSVVIIAGLVGGPGARARGGTGAGTGGDRRGVVAGVSILLLAIVLDRITQAMGAAPKMSRGPVGQLGFGRWPRVRRWSRARRCRRRPLKRGEEMKRHGKVLAVGISLFALLAAACSDVEEEPEAGGGGPPPTPPTSRSAATRRSSWR